MRMATLASLVLAPLECLTNGKRQQSGKYACSKQDCRELRPKSATSNQKSTWSAGRCRLGLAFRNRFWSAAHRQEVSNYLAGVVARNRLESAIGRQPKTVRVNWLKLTEQVRILMRSTQHWYTLEVMTKYPIWCQLYN